MLFCLFIAALWSPEGKGLTSWLLLVMFIVILLLSHPGTGVVLDCIDFWSLLSFLLWPDHLASLVPATVGSASTYPLGNSSDLQTLHTNYCLYYTSFLPSVARDWNERSEQTRNSPIYQNRLNFTLSAPPRYYNTCKRLGQIYQARLRLACSPLRQHMYSKI